MVIKEGRKGNGEPNKKTLLHSTDMKPRQWSPRELEELIDQRATLIVNERRREILRDAGILTVDGKVDMWKHAGITEVRIDGSRIDDLIEHYGAKSGQRVKILLILDPKMIDALDDVPARTRAAQG